MDYLGMYSSKGYVFLAVLARNRVSILNILFSNVCSPVLNGISFLEEATRRRVNSVGREPVGCTGGSRIRAPDHTSTQGLKITEENVLPL